MSAYTDSTGRVRYGFASAEEMESFVATERRECLGAEIRARCDGYDATGDVCRPRLRPKRRLSVTPMMLALAGLGTAHAPPPAGEGRWWR